MEALKTYLKTMPAAEQDAFAKRCDTTLNYLRKAISTKEKLRVQLLIAIERESGGKVRCEDLRSDVDWAYLRGSRKSLRVSA